MVCIPITSKSSRGEQEQNAAFAVKNGNAVLLPEAELNTETLLSKMNEAIDKNTDYQMASEQLQKDMLCYVNGDMRLNIEELSDHEIRIQAF